MPGWIKNTLFGVALLSCMIIGLRVYLELDARSSAETGLPAIGQLSGAPENLPDFSLSDINGEVREISEWADQPLLINFWATWCAPCRREIPLLQNLHAQKSIHNIQVIGIAIDQRSEVERFLAEYGVNYPNLVGEADAVQVSTLFGLDDLGLPFSVLTGADGKILTVHIGEIEAGQLNQLVAIAQAYARGTTPLATARRQLADL